MEQLGVLQKACIHSKRFLKRQSPSILTCMGAVGLVATTVLAVKATPKAMELIKQDSRINHDGDPYAYTPVEAVQSCWTCYVPAGMAGATTLICIFGANMLNQRHQASLVSAYGLLDQSYKKYRQAAKSVYGEDANKKIKAEMAQDVYMSGMSGFSNGTTYLPHLDDSECCLFYDDHSRRYFNSTLAAVINAEYHINRNLQLRGWVSINEFYEFLGIDHIKGGEDVGWRLDSMYESGLTWLDFENEYIELEDGMICYRVMATLDTELYDEED